MVGKVIFGGVALFLMAWLAISMMPDVIDQTDDIRSDPVTTTGIACTTGVGETTCTASLGGEHWKHNTEGMTVTETAPGSATHTTNTTVSADRTQITVSGLSASTAYTLTVAYNQVDSTLTTGYADALRVTPILIPVVVVVAVAVGIMMLARQRGKFA